MMKELETILLAHGRMYPRMTPQDAVKLIYQNEFGGGHLIRDTAACLDYLRAEYDRTVHDPAQPRYTAIGNGLIRVNLAALPARELDRLGDVFIHSAEAHQGSLPAFREKLRLLRRMTEDGLLPFRADALEGYLAQYEATGFPMVSHTQQYRAEYRPAYRVVLESLWLE